MQKLRWSLFGQKTNLENYDVSWRKLRSKDCFEQKKPLKMVTRLVTEIVQTERSDRALLFTPGTKSRLVVISISNPHIYDYNINKTIFHRVTCYMLTSLWNLCCPAELQLSYPNIAPFHYQISFITLFFTMLNASRALHCGSHCVHRAAPS